MAQIPVKPGTRYEAAVYFESIDPEAAAHIMLSFNGSRKPYPRGEAVSYPGKFDIFINTVNIPHISRVSKWIGGHEMNIDCGENHLAFRLELTATPDTPLAQYHASGISLSGTMFFSAAGIYRLRISLSSMNQAAPWGIGLAELYAVPQVKNI